ncbi:beta-lactamase family protein [Sphingobacterium daejeonense]|uniref:serine hydrolase domain-containing protein n=1 Tax=Sphingobacterium daejeonense TaxID=371142 RepID=UPI0021A822D5|nr:serine hydrolase domain-containing protein [Sphingobacterium daejeonense]MCT1532606.1 beta-lactamase family protein [Sphingobacterium daejeonense]
MNKTKKGFKALILLIFAAIYSTGIYAQSATFESELKKITDKYDAVGLAVVVVKNGKPVYEKAFGYKDLETKEPLTTDNLFRIASISKSFSSTAIMQLVEAGKVSLDDDISDLIGFKVRNPKFPNTKITLEMMLSHRSSLNDSNGYFTLDVLDTTKTKDWQKSFNSYEPGTDYEYCNLNFNMIGAVLERLTNVRFDNYIKQQILNPLGLEAGYCVDSLDQRRIAKLYEKEDGKYVEQKAAYNPRSEEIRNYTMGVSTPVFSPTGGMKISAHDLSKYMMMHMNYGKSGKTKIISKASSKKMQTGLSPKENYGLALLENDRFIPGEHMIGHTGSAYGLYSNMFFEPKKKFGFIVITNGCIPTLDRNEDIMMSKEVINLLYTDFIKK